MSTTNSNANASPSSSSWAYNYNDNYDDEYYPGYPTPSAEEQEEVLLASRYGALSEVRRFVETFGVHALAEVRDEHGNSVLHMVCGNGHDDILAYLLSYADTDTTATTTITTNTTTFITTNTTAITVPTTTTTTVPTTVPTTAPAPTPDLPPSLLTARNAARSTPLHWAALNAHLALAQRLVAWPYGPGAALIELKNAAGRTPAGEAEAQGWEEGALWFASVRRVDGGVREEEGEGEGEAPMEAEGMPDVQNGDGDGNGDGGRGTGLRRC